MKRVIRPPIGDPELYRGHTIIVRHTQPDVICEVDGEDLPPFYIDAEAARAGGRRHIDAVEKAKAESEADAKKPRRA